MNSPIQTIMRRAAEKAAKIMIRDFGELEHLQVRRKGPADFVSVADEKCERAIREELQRARPDFGFLGEEGGWVPAEKNAPRWIVDPIDGTTNFLHGIPHFCCSIALERNGQIEAGLIYDPIKDEMFTAEKGKGAYLNGRRLTVSGRENMTEALLATGIPFRGHWSIDDFSAKLKKVAPKLAGMRRNGAAALDLAYVAAGRFDAYWEENIKPWDVAAGILLVQEARGMVTDLDGKQNMLESGKILAANKPLYDQFFQLLK